MRLVNVNAGDLRKRISIETFTTTKDDFGGDVKTFAKLYDASARIEALAGRELELARAIVATATHRVTMRYRTDIDSTMRVRFGERLFGIGAIMNVEEQSVYLVLLCTEEVVSGT